jgi:hypothetical protein
MSADTQVFIDAIGLAAPGLPNWTDAQPILRQASTYQSAEMPRFAPSFLPPNERRRATRIGRLAFQAAEEAMGGTKIPADELAAVFASSGGDTEVMDRICRALATPERSVSPTDFHNSVHNAPAGYWSIATRSRWSSTSLSAFDSSFAVGLLEAVSVAAQEKIPVLLVAYDIRPPLPLLHARKLLDDFSVALVLTPERRPGSHMALRLALNGDAVPETKLDEPALEELRLGNPAARALPLLTALAQGQPARVHLPYFDDRLTVELGHVG